MTDPSAGQVVTGAYRGPEGTRAWRLFVPSSYDRSRPPMMLVLLHGCTQSADDIARGSQMDRLAESRGVLVLYPEQPAQANPRTCWNWFDAAHQHRGAGEPAIIAGMVADVMRQYPADARRVHLAGISAGGAMANLVAVAYPERFASVTVMSGVAWGAARNVGAAVAAMQKGAGDALPSADAVVAAMGDHQRAVPALVIHGGDDKVVAVSNADESVRQWVGVHAIMRRAAGLPALREADVHEGQDGGYTVRRAEWTDAAGLALVRHVRIQELGHAWSGGSPTGSFADPKGPDASRILLEFCEPHQLP